MKQDAANHWKIRALGRALAKRLGDGPNATLGGSVLSPDLAHRLAMGVMESLWIWAKRYYPRGDIGRASDETITENAGWGVDDSGWFLARLIEFKLLDESTKHRLIVHGISDHAEDYVRKSLERAGIRTFADGRPVRKGGPGRPRKAAESAPTPAPEKISTRASVREDEIPPDRTSRDRTRPDTPSRTEPSRGDHRPTRSERQANAAMLAKRAQLNGNGISHGIGSVTAAVADPDYPRKVQALRVYWPPPDPLPEQLAAHPNGTTERVFWAIETAEAMCKRGELRGQTGPGDKRGHKAVPGWVRRAIEHGYEVPAEWVAAAKGRLAGAGT